MHFINYFLKLHKTENSYIILVGTVHVDLSSRELSVFCNFICLCDECNTFSSRPLTTKIELILPKSSQSINYKSKKPKEVMAEMKYLNMFNLPNKNCQVRLSVKILFHCWDNIFPQNQKGPFLLNPFRPIYLLPIILKILEIFITFYEKQPNKK